MNNYIEFLIDKLPFMLMLTMVTVQFFKFMNREFGGSNNKTTEKKRVSASEVPSSHYSAYELKADMARIETHLAKLQAKSEVSVNILHDIADRVEYLQENLEKEKESNA